MDKEICELYKSGLSTVKIAKILNVTIGKVQSTLIRNKIERRSNKQNSRKYKLNQVFFENIDCEEKAYWLGFLFADGYVTKSNNQKQIGLSLSTKDKSHLEKFKSSLHSDCKINTYISKSGYSIGNSYSRVLLSSEKMFDDLNDKGLIERKSLIIKYPNLSKNLDIHFIRGYFDGDGSWAKDKKTKVGFSFKLCGTEEFLTSVCSKLNLRTKLYKRHKDNKNNYYISISGKRVYEIMKILYTNSSIHLERKYNKYIQAKSRCEVIHN